MLPGGLSIHRLFLTFDVEDFVNPRSVEVLRVILRLLKKRHVRGLFFITGHAAERLESFSEVLDLLADQEIGYHSSSHSVRPNIVEYTDLESYEDACLVSLRRETAHIDPSSGEVDGRGGITTLRGLFSQKRIEAYRAPGFSWSPPHLEALRSLGFTCDFSTRLSRLPVCHRGITFYPYPVLIDWKDFVNYYKDLFGAVLNQEAIVLDFHPDRFVNQTYWDSFFPKGAPQISAAQTRRLFVRFENLLRTIKYLEKVKLLEVVAEPSESRILLDVAKIEADDVLEQIEAWSMNRGYKPRFLRSHLLKFFGLREVVTVGSG
jgi:peptidoglycan/xylan/chitin deacetylase (PgdA/CDA1 family)